MHKDMTSYTKCQNQLTEEIKDTLQDMGDLMKDVSHKNLKKYLSLWSGDKGLIKAIEQWLTADEQVERQGKDKNEINLHSYVKLQSEQNSNIQAIGNLISKSHAIKGKSKRNIHESKVKLEHTGQQFQYSKQLDCKFELKRSKKENILYYSRGPYKNYPKQLKQKVVSLYFQNPNHINSISAEYDIPVKNIKRWAENGIQRKQGAGRKKVDPQMEGKVCRRIYQTLNAGSDLSFSLIRKWALEICTVKQFKASKGWIKKFIERNQIDIRYHIV